MLGAWDSPTVNFSWSVLSEFTTFYDCLCFSLIMKDAFLLLQPQLPHYYLCAVYPSVCTCYNKCLSTCQIDIILKWVFLIAHKVLIFCVWNFCMLFVHSDSVLENFFKYLWVRAGKKPFFYSKYYFICFHNSQTDIFFSLAFSYFGWYLYAQEKDKL